MAPEVTDKKLEGVAARAAGSARASAAAAKPAHVDRSVAGSMVERILQSFDAVDGSRPLVSAGGGTCWMLLGILRVCRAWLMVRRCRHNAALTPTRRCRCCCCCCLLLRSTQQTLISCQFSSGHSCLTLRS